MSLSYTGIGFLFHYFGGCSDNEAFLTITLVLSLFSTCVQLTGDEGSLLTSAIMTCYSTYLAYSAVSNNPNETCNPMLGEDDVLGVVLGLVIILGSMTWTCLSYTKSLTNIWKGAGGGDQSAGGSGSDIELDSTGNASALIGPKSSDDGAEAGAVKVQGIVVTNSDRDLSSSSPSPSSGSDDDDGSGWKLNLILSLMSCWYPMILTSWGATNQNGSPANATVGNVSMWMIIAAQWLAMTMYCWTLLAPRIFTDRDFT